MWAEARELKLRGAATLQIEHAKTELETMRTELATRAQEAASWYGVAEELATEHRDSEVLRMICHARGVTLMHAISQWRACVAAMP